MIQKIILWITQNWEIIYEDLDSVLNYVQKMDIIQHWKVAGALQRKKAILLNPNVPHEQVKVFFYWSLGENKIELYLK